MTAEWRGKNVRIKVTRGFYAGQRGRLIRPDRPGTWLVHLDNRVFGATVRTTDMVRDQSE